LHVVLTQTKTATRLIWDLETLNDAAARLGPLTQLAKDLAKTSS